jgi:hypothetical protein
LHAGLADGTKQRVDEVALAGTVARRAREREEPPQGIRRQALPLTALRKINAHRPSSRLKEEERKQTIAPGAPMSLLRHYTIRFRESERLRYRLPRLVWRFLIRASG